MQLSATRDQWARQLFEAAGAAHGNESELRHTVYNILAPYCTTVVGLDQNQLRHEGTSQSGRFDTLLGSTLIEWKTPGELSTRTKRLKHADQALRYLRDERIGAVVVVITDGRTWGILRDPEALDGATTTLDTEMFPPTLDEYFQWRPNSTETASRVLDLLDTIVFEPVTPNSLMNKLGPTSTQGRELLAALTEGLKERQPDDRTDILFRQWLALAGVSYGIGVNPAKWPRDRAAMLGDLAGVIPDVGYAHTIYALHTFVALCSKLIAGEALGLTRGSPDQRPSQWASLPGDDFNVAWEKLENGQLALEMGAPNMMGGDLFGWYADVAPKSPGLQVALRSILNAFAELGWARLTHATKVSSDLLRDFYTRVVPRGLRKGLGEFFTPEWIAERIVDQAIRLSEQTDQSVLRYLDPTCGSGTFLVAAMRRTIRASHAAGLSDAEVAKRAIDAITGFDVNPVSPLMARVNLLLTLGDLADHVPELRLNVFQADSILIPEEPKVGQTTIDQIGSALTVPLVIGNISLPASLATLQAVAGLARNIDASVQRNRDSATFRARLSADFPAMGVQPEDAKQALDSAEVVYEKLRQLHVEGRDGVWAHVIEQSFAPRVLKPVDIVVGNPPWISWKNLPAEWRERSELTWAKWGLWQSKRAGRGTPMGDISTLLLARSISTYCPTGIVALLLPQGVLINEPGGRPIRRAVLSPNTSEAHDFAPLHLDDFSTLNPFPDAATKPVALYVQSGAKAAFPFAGERWERAVPRVALPTDLRFVQAATLLKSIPEQYAPVTPTDTASAWRPALADNAIDAAGGVSGPRYVWGQGFHTRGADGIYFCEVISSEPFPGNLVRIRTRPDLGRNTAHLSSVEALIESRFLWPLLRGANVFPFRTESSGLYAIVPHNPESPTKVLSRDEAVRTAPKMFDYFEPHLERLQGRSAYDMKLDEDYPWGIQGTAWRHMSRSKILVVSRYMMPDARPPAAVVRPVEDPRLGFATTAYPNNKVNFLACSSLAEADYVAAFINSEPAQSTIARRVSSTTIGPSALNALAMPKYDPTDSAHLALADVGNECRIAPRAWPALKNSLDKLVVDFLSAQRTT